MDYKRLEKFDIRGLIFTVGCSVGALIASATFVLPFLASTPLMPLAWLLSFFTEHSGSISDAIIVWYCLFTYFWASRFPFWTVRIVYFFGIINLMIAMGFVYKGINHFSGINTNLFFFMNETTNIGMVLAGIMSIVYLAILYKIAKKGHSVYLAKWKAQDEQDLIEAEKHKKCQFCAEEILSEAKVCKHCGRDV